MTQSSLKPLSCSKLRCTACDKKVVRFAEDVKWKATVDYIFVRNYNTQPEKLREGVEHAAGFSSYACQCKFIAVNEQAKVEGFAQLAWHCGGH